MNCRLCNSSKNEKIMESFDMHGRHINNEKDRFSLFRCSECECVFLAGVPINQNYYAKYYKEGYYENSGKGLMNWTLGYLMLLSRRRKEKIIIKQKKIKEKISILDVGCGDGNFLANLNPGKFEINGVEINEEGRRLGLEKGVKVYEKIEKVEEGKRFDVITMWHVLEHIEKPQEFVKSLKGLLKDNGVLVFQIPNTDGLGFRFGKKFWFHLDSPRHLTLCNKKSIKKLCKLTGFGLVDIKNEFYDYPLDLLWSVRRSKFKYAVYPFYPFLKLFSKEHLTFICRSKQ
jgi:2-polyprenyl-3-methyl-5-hydroxy-6-metoxy-1,4-benzoquinol methylase